MLYQEPALFNDPKIEYPIYNMDLDFDEYITKCRSIIATTRVDLKNNNDAEKIIDANTPFEWKPTSQRKIKAGALLIHGLLDSPFQLRDIGRQLQSQGFLVRSLLLPGHGTVPGALLNTDYHEWIQTVRYGVASLQKEVEQILLVGNSTGASLALDHLSDTSANIMGAILCSPPLKIYTNLAPTANWYKAISWAWKKAAWFHIDPEETIDYAKYSSLTFNAVYQVYRLSQQLKHKHSKQFSCPLFFVVTANDKIVCPKTIIQYFSKHPNSESRLLLYTNQTNDFQDKRIQIRPGAYPEQHIVNISHIAPTISPDDVHYGKAGDFKYASHVDQSVNTVYGEFLRDDLFYNQCMLKLKLTKTHLERLTFNPDFDYMCQSIKNFIEPLFRS